MTVIYQHIFSRHLKTFLEHFLQAQDSKRAKSKEVEPRRATLTVQAAGIPCELGPPWAAPVRGLGPQLVHLPVARVIHNPETQKPRQGQLLQDKETGKRRICSCGCK